MRICWVLCKTCIAACAAPDCAAYGRMSFLNLFTLTRQRTFCRLCGLALVAMLAGEDTMFDPVSGLRLTSVRDRVSKPYTGV